MDPQNVSNAFPYTNRELSWLDFNDRVLDEAFETATPLLDRVNFCGITASNLDEFFMVRVAGLQEQVRSGYNEPDPAGLTPQRQLELIRNRVLRFYDRQSGCLHGLLLPTLAERGIRFLGPDDLDDRQRVHAAGYFSRIVHPVLTPMAVDRSRPFPVLVNMSLYLGIRLRREQDTHFAILQIPTVLPRFVPLPSEPGRTDFILLEDLVVDHLHELFDAYELRASVLFRLTRDLDLEIDEDAEDLFSEIQEFIKKRRRGRPVRLEIEPGCDDRLRSFLYEMLKVDDPIVYETEEPLDRAAFKRLYGNEAFASLRQPAIRPAPAVDFPEGENLFDCIRRRDRMVHHPYESFDSVVGFIRAAAEDDQVLAIKQTLYRVSGHSAIIAALMRAADRGKQVTVLVELKARFDEENNIAWARQLEEAGCHVIYGLVGLKIHCKIALVIRREEEGIRRYLHLGTGNYNDTTARLYTDIGMFTAREGYGADASSLFNSLTGYTRPPAFNRLIAAPDDCRAFLVRMIRQEIEHSRRGLDCGITIKVNSLVDEALIRLFYEASCAGVPIRLVVRGICCLVPGIPGVSENIQVFSLVGRFLEHSRIFRFENAGEPKLYLGSADLMPRNLDRRVELLFPIDEPVLIERLEQVLAITLADNVNRRVQDNEGRYSRIRPAGEARLDSQRELERLAATGWNPEDAQADPGGMR
ncbi:MAG: polyphosphate kinase 1 [Clostridiaceae bacterium]|nr:polyphosphate kinase 1 [Clostridiaceae bacterium]